MAVSALNTSLGGIGHAEYLLSDRHKVTELPVTVSITWETRCGICHATEAASSAHALMRTVTGSGTATSTGRSASSRKSEAASSGRAGSADGVCFIL